MRKDKTGELGYKGIWYKGTLVGMRSAVAESRPGHILWKNSTPKITEITEKAIHRREKQITIENNDALWGFETALKLVSSIPLPSGGTGEFGPKRSVAGSKANSQPTCPD